MSTSTGSEVSFTFNGDSYEGVPGQSIAAALMASGVRELRATRFHKEPRLIFCGIGVCFDCVVVVNGVANQRACLVEIAQDDEIVSSK
jgi:aerobic-type carbon monoxide dehydrogenase small subunit (CoxS/CutS family)